jgi:hypothetical protein
MQLLDQHLADLVNRELIYPVDAYKKSLHPERLTRLIETGFKLNGRKAAENQYDYQSLNSKNQVKVW